MTTAALPDVDDPAMATACPMQLIAGVTVEEIERNGVIVDREIAIVLDCNCRYFLSLKPGKVPPRPGEPSHCRMAHGPFQSEEPA